MKKNVVIKNLGVWYMPVKVMSVGRGIKMVKNMPVVKKTEELKGMGKGKVRDLVLKEDIPKKYISFK